MRTNILKTFVARTFSLVAQFTLGLQRDLLCTLCGVQSHQRNKFIWYLSFFFIFFSQDNICH